MGEIAKQVRKWFHDREFFKAAELRRQLGVTLKRDLDLTGKHAVVFGVASDKSIAWSIAKTLNDNGCQVALGYQERVEDYVKELAKELKDPVLVRCDVTSDEMISNLFSIVKEQFGKVDYIVHSVAFAKKEFLSGEFMAVDRKGFSTAMEVSAFSLSAVVKAASGLLVDGGSVITLSYLGSNRAMSNYNVMGVCKAALESSVRYLAKDLGLRGVRVNAISAGPVETLAASGIKGFDEILGLAKEKSLLKRNISAEDVANMALFLCSPISKNVTGQVLYVDAGFSVSGLISFGLK